MEGEEGNGKDKRKHIKIANNLGSSGVMVG